MSAIQQNTLYLLTPGSYIRRDHLTLCVEVPIAGVDSKEHRKLAVPIHHLESICVFGPSTISAPALDLCWEHDVAVNYLSEYGHLQARLTGVANTSVLLRRTQFRCADDPVRAGAIARQIIAGKIQNSRNSLLRAARETSKPDEQDRLQTAAESLAQLLRVLAASVAIARSQTLDELRGIEGLASQQYFGVFTLCLKQQRDAFAFTTRSRRPPRDRVNCALSFLYALVRHDCVAALTSAGLDPFVGFLHADRPNRPSLALDLLEEFRPWLADRLVISLVNRGQLRPDHFREREGGAVELTEAGRKQAITAYQERKQESMKHPLLDQTLRAAQLPFVQARILARHLRGDLPHYLPFIPK
jgi:CRISPR-associated protein Cas1